MRQHRHAQEDRQSQEGIGSREIWYPSEGIIIRGSYGGDRVAEQEHQEDLQACRQEVAHRRDSVLLTQGVDGPQEPVGVIRQLLLQSGNFRFQLPGEGLVLFGFQRQGQQQDSQQQDTEDDSDREVTEESTQPLKGDFEWSREVAEEISTLGPLPLQHMRPGRARREKLVGNGIAPDELVSPATQLESHHLGVKRAALVVARNDDGGLVGNPGIENVLEFGGRHLSDGYVDGARQASLLEVGGVANVDKDGPAGADELFDSRRVEEPVLVGEARESTQRFHSFAVGLQEGIALGYPFLIAAYQEPAVVSKLFELFRELGAAIA